MLIDFNCFLRWPMVLLFLYIVEIFRCTINIKSLQYRDELVDFASVAFRELSGKVASAIQRLYDDIPGQQTVKVLLFRYGKLTTM